MTLDALVAFSLRFVAVVGVIQALLNIIGTHTYDIRSIKQQRFYAHHPHARRYRHRPLVSVLVVARNDASSIEQCLAALVSSSYRKLEIIVIDNASTDTTKRLISRFVAVHPKHAIRLVAKRTVASRLAAARASYRTYGTGEIVMPLSAAAVVDKQAIARAIRHFNDDTSIAAITPRYSVRSAYSSLGVLRRYQDLLRYRTQKLGSAFNAEYATDAALWYSREAFLALPATRLRPAKKRPGLGNKQARPYYADDVLVSTDAPRTLDQLLIRQYRAVARRVDSLITQRHLCFTRDTRYTIFFTWFRLPLAVCTGLAALLLPLLISYFLYISIILQEPTFLLVSGALLSTLLVFAIGGDEQLRPREKLTYTVGIPLTYGLFYATSLIQAVAIVKSLLTPSRAIGDALE